MKIDFSTIAYVTHSIAGPLSNLRGFVKDIQTYLSEAHPAILEEKTNPKGMFTIGYKIDCLVRDSEKIVSEINRIKEMGTGEAYEIIQELVTALNQQIDNDPSASERTNPAILDKAETFLNNWK
jgi:hypothetical protein